MRKFIIRNTNANRECHYETCNGKEFEEAYPFWLKGDYVVNSSGDTHNDITRAHLYNDRKAADKQRAVLQAKFAVGGPYFDSKELGYRYPDSVGKKGYGPLAPKYEVVEVEVTVTVVAG